MVKPGQENSFSQLVNLTSAQPFLLFLIWHFRKKKIKSIALIKNPFFLPEIIFRTDIILYSFETSFKWPFLGIFPVGVNKNLKLQIHAEGTRSEKISSKIDFKAIYHFRDKSYHTSET